MIRFDFLEKIKIFTQLVFQPQNILILGFFIILSILLLLINQKNKKRYQVIYLILLLSLLIGMLFLYYPYLGKLFQNMMDNFFILVYFPNLSIYLAAIITTNIILWISVLNTKSSKYIRYVNTMIYLFLNYLFILIIQMIQKEKLDVFSQSSIYHNDQIRVLIELSSIVFFGWIVFLILYKVLLIYLSPKEKEEIIRKDYEEKIEKEYRIISSPNRVYQKNKIRKKSKEDPFSLEDYKLFSEILKNQKGSQQKNENPNGKYKAMDNEYSESIFGNPKEGEKKQEKKPKLEEYVIKEEWQEPVKEQEKMTELERLYQSIKY